MHAYIADSSVCHGLIERFFDAKFSPLLNISQAQPYRKPAGYVSNAASRLGHRVRPHARLHSYGLGRQRFSPVAQPPILLPIISNLARQTEQIVWTLGSGLLRQSLANPAIVASQTSKRITRDSRPHPLSTTLISPTQPRKGDHNAAFSARVRPPAPAQVRMPLLAADIR